jgi:uncharacterized protein YpuA (DUF1002 family)
VARELILIPKLKYEKLMNDVKQARKNDEEKEHSTADTIQSATNKNYPITINNHHLKEILSINNRSYE